MPEMLRDWRRGQIFQALAATGPPALAPPSLPGAGFEPAAETPGCVSPAIGHQVAPWPESGSERNRIASMRPAMAAPSEGVNGSGEQALTAARMLATIFSLKPGSAGART